MNSPVLQNVEIVVARFESGPAAKGPDAGEALLSPAERQSALRFRLPSDRRRFVAARALLRRLLAARLGLPPESLRIESGEQGKPMLVASRLQFSLSYSDALMAYAFAHGRAVGIDVEALRPFEEADAVAERTFHRRERRAYKTLAARDKPAGFFRGWTRVEALAKALGGGLQLPREALDAALEHGWSVQSFCPAPGYAGAVALSGAAPATKP